MADGGTMAKAAESPSGTMGKYMYAFDFDGVLCDSAGETGTMGLAALRALVPSTPHVSCSCAVACLGHALRLLLDNFAPVNTRKQ